MFQRERRLPHRAQSKKNKKKKKGELKKWLLVLPRKTTLQTFARLHSTQTAPTSFIDHEVDLLSKKSSTKKPTKNQLVNDEIKDTICAVLGASDEPMTVLQLITNPDIAAFGTAEHPITTQRVSALLTQMSDPNGEDKRVKRVENKKKALFVLNA